MARLTLSASLALLLAFAGAAFAARAADSVQPALGPPPSVTFLISGHGWGHGVGMSQWGALGFAEHGAAYDRILAHFYPGTKLASAPQRTLRVLVAERQKTLTVSSIAPFQVVDGDGVEHPLAAGVYTFGPELALDLAGDGQQVALPGPLTFTPGLSPVSLGVPSYRGSIEVSVTHKRLSAFDVVDLEDYLRGVVPAEMPASWPPEALKAQAVAARSYALARLGSGGAFDLFGDTRSQAYGGVDAETDETDGAVAASRGQVLTYGGKIAETFFFSSSGGRTASLTDVYPAARPVPYLVSVSDPYDRLSPYHDWGPVTVSGPRAARLLKLPGELVDLAPLPGAGGRARIVVASGTNGDAQVLGKDFRAALDLRSTWLTIGVLSLARPSGPFVYGSAVQLTGVLRNVGAATLDQRPAGGVWLTGEPVVPGANGDFTAVVRPQVTTWYRLSAQRASGTAVRVAVAPQVALRRAPDGSGVAGSTLPAFPGTGIEIQRRDAPTDSWQTVATSEVAADGTFSLPLVLTPGDYRAVVAPGHGLVAGASPRLQVAAA